MDVSRRSFIQLTGALFGAVLGSGAAGLVGREIIIPGEAAQKLILPSAMPKPEILLGMLADKVGPSGEWGPIGQDGPQGGPVGPAGPADLIHPLVTFQPGGFSENAKVASAWFKLQDFPICDHFPPESDETVYRRVDFYADGRPLRISDVDAQGLLTGYRVSFKPLATHIFDEYTMGMAQYAARTAASRYERDLAGVPEWHVDISMFRVPEIRFAGQTVSPSSWWWANRAVANRWVRGIPKTQAIWEDKRFAQFEALEAGYGQYQHYNINNGLHAETYQGYRRKGQS